MSTQFTTENSESKIQSQPIVLSATGAAHGSRIRKRRNHFPRKSLISWCARSAATRTTIRFESTVKTTVLRSARRKFSSAHWSTKLSSPTNSPLSEPAVASVRLR